MKRKRKVISESRGVLYAIMLLLAFLLFLFLLIGGIYLFQVNRDFYSALEGRLRRGFYLSALSVLIFSSILYTPFSYGISRYFILSYRGEAGVGDLFFLFRTPLLMLKAVAVTMVKKVLIYLEQLLLLLLAALAEVALFFSFLVVTGEDVFSVQENPFRLAADFMLRSPALITLSIVLWASVLLWMLVIYLRYVLCKYVLLQYPAVGVWQAIRIGRDAIRGKVLQTLLFYLRYGAFCVLTLLAYGLSKRIAKAKRHRSFSVYACDLAEQGWRTYCRRRSLR